MKRFQFACLGLLLCNPLLADSTDIAATESRDAAAAYVAGANFVVGRMARDCFDLLERKDTPKEFVGQWQKRNEKYFLAMIAYTQSRFDQARRSGGEKAWQQVADEFATAVRGNGAATVDDFFKKGEKAEVCRRTIAMMETGGFDIGPQSPLYAELEALVADIPKP